MSDFGAVVGDTSIWCETACYACVGECASKVPDNSIPDDVGKPEDTSNASEPDDRRNEASEGFTQHSP